MASNALADRVVRLRREVADHKSAIARHREALGRAKAALVALEAESREHGIGLRLATSTTTTQHGEGNLHGRSIDSSTS